MLKHTLIAAALAALLATPAFAQPSTSNTSTPAAQTGAAASSSPAKGASAQPAGFMHSQNASEWRGTKLIGATVYGPDKNAIGDINDVLIDKDGRVTAVVVGVGGFLGVGEKNVALPFQALNVERKQGESAIGKITVSYTKNQLKSAPRFAYYKAGQTETTGSGTNENAKTPTAPNANSKSKMK